MRKKIMLVVPMLHQGGFERVCVATARLLQPFFDVYIVIFDSKDIAYDIKGLDVIDLHLGVKKGIVRKAVNVLKRCSALKQTKEKLGIDISYSFGSTANLVNVLSGSQGKRWVGLRSYMDMGNKRKIQFFCRRADRILCCSKVIEEEIAGKYRSGKAVTVYNPLDIKDIKLCADMDEARIPWEDTEHIFISMGREDNVKGYWHLLKSFSIVVKSVSDAKLMIVGDGEFNEYRQLAKELGIGDAVYFSGMKKNPFPYLNTAAVYVLTSYNEGFPNALLEAMAFGLPSIATDCLTGPREILMKDYIPEDRRLTEGEALYGDYGVLVPNMSPMKNMDAAVITAEEELLAQQMTRLLTDDELRSAYAKAALLRAADFSKDAYVKKMIELIS